MDIMIWDMDGYETTQSFADIRPFRICRSLRCGQSHEGSRQQVPGSLRFSDYVTKLWI